MFGWHRKAEIEARCEKIREWHRQVAEDRERRVKDACRRAAWQLFLTRQLRSGDWSSP
jgi:hypothetical protein